MIIENVGLPVAGKQFDFVIASAVGKTTIELYIDASLILEVDCPDPPCHESIIIPISTRGSMLRIVASDASGNRAKREFTINEADLASEA